MSAEQMAALFAAVAADPTIAAAFSSATDPDDVVRRAAAVGFEISAEDVRAAVTGDASRELNEAQLAAVAGGSTVGYTGCPAPPLTQGDSCIPSTSKAAGC